MAQSVFYEEEGGFKVGAVLADNDTSLQVEAPHGKRSKVKASAVLFRFDAQGLAHFMEEAGRVAETLDADFLWQCSGPGEFAFDSLAREYFGRAPAPVESAALLLRLHGAPMYFYKKGRGRYRAAPPESLKAALASIERKRLEAEKRERYVAQLVDSKLPPEFELLRASLLYQPERQGLEWKALEEACEQLKTTPARLFERCGALPSSHDYHLDRFLREFFPRGTAFPDLPPPAAPQALPLADARAFSIDDAPTTEIDDAFSVAPLPGGGQRIGIHIAAPALGIARGDALDAVARERLSTVYFPGAKITMLPPAAIEAYTLAQGRECPALSLYLDVGADGAVGAQSTRLERVTIAANLDRESLEPVLDDAALAGGRVDHPYGAELSSLWRFATAREAARRGSAAEIEQRADYSFHVADDRVRIARRRRGTPVDRVVSELMILVNGAWGRELARAGAVAIYRVQGRGKVGMSTVPAAHEGLGVDSYAWASSPLRRYADLVNQRQLIALARGEAPPYAPNDEALLGAMRDFEFAHDAYNEFQRQMERYWCLRWIIQEGVHSATASVIRESLVRFEDVPLVARVPSLPALPAGARVELAVGEPDLLELTVRCDYRRELPVDGEGLASNATLL